MGRQACFIPGCKTGYSKDRLKRKMAGQRIPSLFKPRSVEQLEQWRKYIPRADKILDMHHRVCALHFIEEDIIKYFETEIYDGTLFKLERGRYRLVEDAVPLIYPCLPNYLTKIAERRRRMKQKCGRSSDKIIIQKMRLSCDSSENSAVDVEESLETSSIDENQTHNQNAENSDSAKNFELDVSEPSKEFTYTELTDNIDYIVRPNILWGITCHELFIICALWSVEGELLVKVMIDKSMDTKVCLKGETIVLKNGLTCIEDVSALLSKINSDIIADCAS